MKWDQTISSQCRYAHLVKRIYGEWNIIWEKSNHASEGCVRFLARQGRRYCYCVYSYGSNENSDIWQRANLSDEQVMQEIEKSCMTFKSKQSLNKWRTMLEYKAQTTPTCLRFSGAELLVTINAMRTFFGLHIVDWSDL